MDKTVADGAADPTWRTAIFLSFSAFMGAALRSGRWMDAAGKVLWGKILLDVPGSVAFGIMSLGLSIYIWKDNVSVWVAGGIAGFLGMVGPAFVEAIATKWLGMKSNDAK